MNRISAASIALVCLYLVGCVQWQGYVEIRPGTSKVFSKIERPITINLENIPDEMVVTGANVPLNVIQFRRTLTYALKDAFQNSFTHVNDDILWNGVGYRLTVRLMEPHFKVVDYSFGSDGVRYPQYACAFQVKAWLYEGGREVSAVDREIIGPRREQFEKKGHLFTRGLKLVVEELHESIVITSELDKKQQ